MKKRHWFSRILIALSLGTFLTELIRYWVWGHKPEWWVFAMAAFPGFFGFYLENPQSAKDAFGFATDQTIKIITVIRGGRAGERVAETTVVVPPSANVQVTPPPEPPANPHTTSEG
jgi:hypothetical protein